MCVDFADRFIQQDGIAGGGQALLQDVLMDREPDMCFEGMGNVVFADEEECSQTVERDVLVQMILNVVEQLAIEVKLGLNRFWMKLVVHDAADGHEQGYGVQADEIIPAIAAAVQFFQQLDDGAVRKMLEDYRES